MSEYVRMGKRGTLVVPAELRRAYGLEEGEMLVMEQRPEGLLLKPVRAFEVEVYSPARRIEFLLNNAVTAEEYDRALSEAREVGVDPATVPHGPRPRE